METVARIERSLADCDVVQTTLLIHGRDNTPARVWRSKASGLPVKAEHGASNDAGQFTGTFVYYFIDGEVWFADQIFARYLFEGEDLKHWLDESWNRNHAPAGLLRSRGKYIRTTLGYILSATNP